MNLQFYTYQFVIFALELQTEILSFIAPCFRVKCPINPHVLTYIKGFGSNGSPKLAKTCKPMKYTF